MKHDEQNFVSIVSGQLTGDGPLANRRQCLPSGDPEKAMNTPIVISDPFSYDDENQLISVVVSNGVTTPTLTSNVYDG